MAPGENERWDTTAIWERLKELAVKDNADDATGHAKAVSVALAGEGCLPAIQSILDAGGSNTDFTLHDAGHSFRVARHMREIILDATFEALNAYELALLLLSAYLHDIAMTPDLGRVRKYQHYLTTGETGGAQDIAALEGEDLPDVQKWVDDWEHDIEVPMDATDIRGVSHALQHFCRAQHVAWCSEWIATNFVDQSLGGYAQWTRDLDALCQSHHEGYAWLRSDQHVQPYRLGEPSVVVNLRYLAMVLRVADVLEFDPERTPAVVFQHRDVDRRSAAYWRKDHHISFALERDDEGRVHASVTARLPDATLHNAVETMVDGIEVELALTRRLADDHLINHVAGHPVDLPHTWDLPAHIHRDIRPLDNAYEYIDGAFRPNTDKLLQLFGGQELYGDDPFVFARELLQNAFDAVREQIAYEKLQARAGGHDDWNRDRGDRHRVELRLELEDDCVWLRCTDDGVGMTRDIIERYVLVSGNTRRASLRELQRRCDEAGIELNRTGQFGIGVLSYFMAADRVEIETRRSTVPGDDDGVGWMFTTEGVGAFGELRRKRRQEGMSVRLRMLQEDIDRHGDAAGWYGALAEYLGHVLRHVPCRFVLNGTVVDKGHWNVDAGWVWGAEDLARLAGDACGGTSCRRTVPPTNTLHRHLYSSMSGGWKLPKRRSATLSTVCPGPHSKVNCRTVLGCTGYIRRNSTWAAACRPCIGRQIRCRPRPATWAGRLRPWVCDHP